MIHIAAEGGSVTIGDLLKTLGVELGLDMSLRNIEGLNAEMIINVKF